MSITNPQINTYRKDTHHNIVNSSPLEEGQWAFAVDTGSLFVSRGGGWIQWNSDSKIGSHTFTDTQGQQITLPYSPVAHLDATNLNSLETVRGSQPSDGSAIKEWQSSNGGNFKLTQQLASFRPMYDANGMGTGRPSVDFTKTKLTTPDQYNDCMTGDFTIIMALKFHPIWLNNDHYRTTYTGNAGQADEFQGTNEMISTQDNFTIFGGAAQSYDGATSIAASIASGHAATTYSHLRYSLHGGSQHYDTYDNTTTWMGDMDVGRGGDDNGLHYGLRNINAAYGTNYILTFRMTSAREYNWGSAEQTICGAAWTSRRSVYGDFTLKGLGIGTGYIGAPVTKDGGNFQLGEMIVYNDQIETEHLNQIGTYLSSKWSAPWINI